MLALVVVIIILLIFSICIARGDISIRGAVQERFENWPVPHPLELGAPTPPSIFGEHKREITVPKNGEVSGEVSGGMGGSIGYGAGMYGGPSPYSPYSPYGVYNPYGTYGQYGLGAYGPGTYGQYGISPLQFGGNTSGSTSIGGFGPAQKPNMLTPAMVQGGMSTLAVTPALSPASVLSPSAVTTPAITPSAVTPAMTPSALTPSILASRGGLTTRARTVADEANIAGYDWAGAAAQSAAAYEPSQTSVVDLPSVASMETAVTPASTFSTVTAADVLQGAGRGQTSVSTAISLPTITAQISPSENTLESLIRPTAPQSALSAISQQKLSQTAFGSVQPNFQITDATAGMGAIRLPKREDVFKTPATSGQIALNSHSSDTAPTDINWNLLSSKINTAQTVQPLFASTSIGTRGSRHQPSSMPDSKSTQTIIDTAPGQVATATTQQTVPTAQTAASSLSSAISA